MNAIMMKLKYFSILCCILFAACKKQEHAGQANQDRLKQLPGVIYYKWADQGVYKLDFKAGERSLFLEDNINRNGWDVSLDGKLLLESKDVPGKRDVNEFSIRNASSGTLIQQFTYEASDGDIVSGTFSPDGKMIALSPTFKDGIVLLDLQGKVLSHILQINGEKIEREAVWAPDNSLLIPHGRALLKTNKDFSALSLIAQLDFDQWGALAISRDGSKIAFAASGHIWLMNADGSGLKQVTRSTAAESRPQFSPDGKFLLIGTDYHTTGLFGSLFYLKVVPADGQEYQVDDGQQSAEVISVQLPGSSSLEAGDGGMRWR